MTGSGVANYMRGDPARRKTMKGNVHLLVETTILDLLWSTKLIV